VHIGGYQDIWWYAFGISWRNNDFFLIYDYFLLIWTLDINNSAEIRLVSDSPCNDTTVSEVRTTSIEKWKNYHEVNDYGGPRGEFCYVPIWYFSNKIFSKPYSNFLRGWTKFSSPLIHHNCLYIWLHNNSFHFHYNWMKLTAYVDYGLGNWLKGVMKPYNNFLRGWTKFCPPSYIS